MTILEYRLLSLNRYDTFEHAPPWRGVLDSWNCVLAGDRLVAQTDRPFASAELARADLEPRLSAWQAVAYLNGQYEITFRFDGGAPAEGAQEPADPDGEDRIYRRTNDGYPPPDPSFTRTELVEQLLDDIGRFRRGEESLPAVAAVALRRLRTLANGSDSVTSLAAALNVEPDVIAKAIELAAQDRGPITPGDGPPAYRGPEWQWLQEALPRLTLQAGRASDGPPAKRLTMDDFATRL